MHHKNTMKYASQNYSNQTKSKYVMHSCKYVFFVCNLILRSFDVLHYHVTEIRTVSPGSVSDGYVKVRVLSETMNPQEFNASKVSLGVLGVISQVHIIHHFC